MYLWYKLLSYGLFQTSAAEFPLGLGADGGITPDISVTSSVAASKEDYKEGTGTNAMAMHIGSLMMVQSKMNREKITNVIASTNVGMHRKYSRMSIFVEKVEKAEEKLEVHEDTLWKYCEEKGIENIEGFEVQANDPYVVKQKKRCCQNAQKLLKDYKDQLRMGKEAHENLDMQLKMKHQVIDGLQDATEMVAVASTPAPLQEITPH